MPRKGPVAKRDVLPDPIYNSKLVTRLINRVMIDGKRGIAASIIYNAFDIIKFTAFGMFLAFIINTIIDVIK